MPGERNDDAPAVPFAPMTQQMIPNSTSDQSYVSCDSGMSLRDWFAGMALQGILASDTSNVLSAENAALWALEVADAVLAARETQP